VAVPEKGSVVVPKEAGLVELFVTSLLPVPVAREREAAPEGESAALVRGAVRVGLSALTLRRRMSRNGWYQDFACRSLDSA
jgi:hypothetical protein